jgi:hypothetical protein
MRELPHDCKICRTGREYRAAWGCEDKPARELFEIECPECSGIGCARCGGGLMRLTVCPNKMLSLADGGEIAALNYFHTVWLPSGAMPGDGGMLDQPATFVAAVEILAATRARVEADQHDRRAREATMAARRRSWRQTSK